jgi:AraC family transcriptional regulator
MRSLDEIVFDSGTARAARFTCSVSDTRFRDSGPTSNALVAFPRRPVWIRHVGKKPFLADPTVSTIYNPGQEFTRSVLSEDGDRSEWFAVAPSLAREIAAAIDPHSQDEPERPFRKPYAPIDSALYLRQRILFSRIERGLIDPLEAEQSIIELVATVIGCAHGQRPPQPHVRAADAHRDLVQRARAALASSMTERVSLTDLARRLSVSEFHLCRVFREQTGLTLHAFQTELRLRTGLEMLADTRLDISRIALELGFSSHSHFSDTLRRRFSRTPISIRRSLVS